MPGTQLVLSTDAGEGNGEVDKEQLTQTTLIF